jgi:FkbM family methyltransferase
MSVSAVRETIRRELNTRSRLRLIRGTMRRVGRAYRYYRLCGVATAVRCLIAERRGAAGLVAVQYAPLAREIQLRLGSTDIRVAGKILLEREYELPLARDPEVIIDAGAYTGISSVWFAARYPNARIVSLEPDASNFELLQRNASQEKRITPLREALWSEDRMVDISDVGNGEWGRRIDLHSDSQGVKATSMSSLILRLGLNRVDLLKLDIEGAEADLFEGDYHAWLQSVDAIAVEIHEDFRPGSRKVVLDACADFSILELGHETLLLQRR